MATINEILAGLKEDLDKLGISAEGPLNKVTEKFKEMQQAAERAAGVSSNFNDITQLTDKANKAFGMTLQDNSEFFKKLSGMTQQQTNMFSVLATSVLGVSKLFANMSDNRGLITLSGQFKNLIADADATSKPFRALASAFGFNDINLGNLKGIKDQLLGMISKLGEAADKSIMFSRSIFDLSAQTGTLENLYNQTGDSLENLLNVSEQYSNQLRNIGIATSTTEEKMGQYFDAIKQLPGMLDRTATSGDNSAQTITEFQKAIQLAHGTGQDFTDVMHQLTNAFETYGVTGKEAFNFVSRSAQLNKEFKINLNDTKGFINEMSNAFQKLGDNTDSMTGLFEKLFTGLRAGGLGIKPAIEAISDVGKSLAGLTIAQKAFISSRSGGPGGLLGGIQIEKDLAAGKSLEVFEKIRESFTKQVGGRIMTRDQVNTQQDAAQFTKQRALLQSGAFGNIAKSDEQAAALLKAFANPGQVDKRSADEVLNQTVKEGINYEKMTATATQEISAKLDAMRGAGGFALARTGVDMARGSQTEVNAITSRAQDNSVKKVDGGNRSGEVFKDNTLDIGNNLTNYLPKVVQSGMHALSNNFITPDILAEEQKKSEEEFNKTKLKIQRTALESRKRSLPPQQQAAMRSNLDREEVAAGLALPGKSGLVRAAAAQSANMHENKPSTNASNVNHPRVEKPDNLDLTVNVYLPNGKKETSQQQIQIAPGMQHGVNGNN